MQTTPAPQAPEQGESQFLASRSFTPAEIATVFKISPNALAPIRTPREVTAPPQYERAIR
jgi:hypothetical protein